jgi:hypothetical protein
VLVALTAPLRCGRAWMTPLLVATRRRIRARLQLEQASFSGSGAAPARLTVAAEVATPGDHWGPISRAKERIWLR